MRKCAIVKRVNESPQSSLARKYAHILRLRTVQIDEKQAQAEMRDLAREFPGALRELDELPLEVIERRLARVTATIDPEPWMIAAVRYHQALKELLAKKATARTEPKQGSMVDAAVSLVASAMGLSMPEADALIFVGLRRRRSARRAT